MFDQNAVTYAVLGSRTIHDTLLASLTSQWQRVCGAEFWARKRTCTNGTGFRHASCAQTRLGTTLQQATLGHLLDGHPGRNKLGCCRHHRVPLKQLLRCVWVGLSQSLQHKVLVCVPAHDGRQCQAQYEAHDGQSCKGAAPAKSLGQGSTHDRAHKLQRGWIVGRRASANSEPSLNVDGRLC